MEVGSARRKARSIYPRLSADLDAIDGTNIQVRGTGTMFVYSTTPTTVDSAEVFVVAKAALATIAHGTRGATATNASTTCPDLSGDYIIQGEDGQVGFAIDQRRCDSVGVVWNDVGRVSQPRGPIAWYLVDGAMHQVGKGMAAAASISSDGMTIVREPKSAADSSPGRTTFRYKRLQDADLCVIDWSGSMRASRYNGSERERNAAADRSEHGC